MNDVLDLAIKDSENAAKLRAEQVKAHYEQALAAPLKPFLDGAPVWKREILEYAPAAQSVVDKVKKTKYAADGDLFRECEYITAAIDAVNTVDLGLAQFKRLTPQDFLLRTTGEID